MKFKLQSTDDFDMTTVTYEFESSTWYEAVDQFVKFLRGSGYSLGNDSVGINLGGTVQHMFLEDIPCYNITYFDSKGE